jgi:glycosyltransferase involved in cell wall biosynthesis
MKVIHWNTSKERQQMSGLKRYEDNLFENLKTIGKDLEIERIQRSENMIFGSMPFSWLFRYKCKDADIVHAIFQTIAPAVYFRFRKPKRFIVNVLDLAQFAESFTNVDLSLRMQSALSPKALKKADMIITISEFTKKEIIKHLKYPEEKIRVVYEGINLELYKPGIQSEEIIDKYGLPTNQKKILYVGSEDPRKNLHRLIKAFYKLKKKYGNVKLIKAGTPQWKGERDELMELIKSLNLENDIIFTGYVSDDDLPKLYNAADLYVSPSILEGGFALPILEAMACGCPVVVSNIPVLVETAGADTGVMVNPKDVDGLANAMHEVLTNEDLRNKMIEKGLERARMFTWRKTAEDVLKIYEEVMIK